MSQMQPPLHNYLAVGILASVSYHILFCDVHWVSGGVRYPQEVVLCFLMQFVKEEMIHDN